jgi:hypothetical protein
MELRRLFDSGRPNHERIQTTSFALRQTTQWEPIAGPGWVPQLHCNQERLSWIKCGARLSRHRRHLQRGKWLMADPSKMTWYVSYIASGSMFEDRPHRATKTFASEDEAREFARARSAAGDQTLIAGTINPVLPKRVISSASIPAWLDEAKSAPPS